MTLLYIVLATTAGGVLSVAIAAGLTVHVLGRLDNLFISGGENIQPEEIEKALLALPGISQAIVVPIDNAEFGQRPVAFVEAESWNEAGWEQALRQLLPGFKIPARFCPWPADQSGLKPSRAALQELAARG